MKRTIWFDMDGTLNRFYDVPDWLPKLRAADPSPYADAAVNLNMSLLARYLNKLQKIGYRIGVISWVAMDSTKSYKKTVTEVKAKWLKIHLNSVEFDEINIVDYGVPKELYMTSMTDILFDDNKDIREHWLGKAYEPDDILKVLKELVEKG